MGKEQVEARSQGSRLKVLFNDEGDDFTEEEIKSKDELANKISGAPNTSKEMEMVRAAKYRKGKGIERRQLYWLLRMRELCRTSDPFGQKNIQGLLLQLTNPKIKILKLKINTRH